MNSARWTLAFSLALAGIVMLPVDSQAAPIYLVGNECPGDAVIGTGVIDRQYYVTTATNCVYDLAVSNIQGTTTEANTYLNVAAAQPAWGTGWIGLGQETPADGGNPAVDLLGFTYTADAGNDDGTFAIDTSILNYGQFALAVKDGGKPKWAIFLLPAGVVAGDWGLGTDGGSLSHFALFARDPGTMTPVPEPGVGLLVAGGLLALGVARRRRTAR